MGATRCPNAATTGDDDASATWYDATARYDAAARHDATATTRRVDVAAFAFSYGHDETQQCVGGAEASECHESLLKI